MGVLDTWGTAQMHLGHALNCAREGDINVRQNVEWLRRRNVNALCHNEILWKSVRKSDNGGQQDGKKRDDKDGHQT